MAVCCYDDLSRLLWGLEGLPLTVSAVQGAHPVLRYTEVWYKEALYTSLSVPQLCFSPLCFLPLDTLNPTCLPQPSSSTGIPTSPSPTCLLLS